MKKKKIFIEKTFGAQIYEWSPPLDKLKPKNNKPKKLFYCNALDGSQGQDWVTSYVYSLSINSKNEQQRIAYVACDYVQ